MRSVQYNHDTMVRILARIAFLFCAFSILWIIWGVIESSGRYERKLTVPPWFEPVAIAAPGTTPKRIFALGRINERFVVSWPKSLTAGDLDYVAVRITANMHENIMRDLAGEGRRLNAEGFKGSPNLDVTLTPSDPGLFVQPQHSNKQAVISGQRYREWTWSVMPQAPGKHQLVLLVRGTFGSMTEDYDPDVESYDVSFNPRYWFITSLQQNAANWIWALFLSMGTGALGWWLRGRSRHRQD